MIYGLLGIVIIILIILLFKKYTKDFREETEQKVRLEKEIEGLRHEKELLDDTLSQKDEAITQANENYRKELLRLNDNHSYEIARMRTAQEQRKTELDEDFQTLLAAKKELYNREVQDYDRTKLECLNEIWDDFEETIGSYVQRTEAYKKQLDDIQNKYQSIIKPIQLLEKEQQEKQFYCIQVSENSKEDIDYLFEFVAEKVHNKDLIPKLIWQEYIQRPLQETLKRANIKDEPGIYKITNIKNNKCYIGKSTKVRQRLIDHVKGSLGISIIADQRIHQEMMRESLWNWTFECICTCGKDELSEKEKYYIDFFNSQEHGFNITSGG